MVEEMIYILPATWNNGVEKKVDFQKSKTSSSGGQICTWRSSYCLAVLLTDSPEALLYLL